VSESDIVRSICDYLAYKKRFFWRQNTAPTFDTTQSRYRAMPAYAMRGVPDIILIRNGTFVGLEVKQATGRLSPEQRIFQEEVQKAGGEYHVVHSIEEVIALGL